MKNVGRRSFLKLSATAGLLAMANRAFAASSFLKPVSVDNPLKAYPSRDWEKVYRDMYKEDSHFVFLCVPNDTHNCLLKAHVKNDVVVRISPSYKFGEATGMDGTKASHRWDPRCCNKGLVLARRVYSDRRPKGAMVRKGFKEWADAGYPRNDPMGFPEKKYLQRGKDPFIKLPWDEAFALCAKTFHNIATTYSGESGAHLLEKQGYDHEMIHAMHGAGVETMKFRGGMALLGITRIFGQKRMAQMMALLDANVRKLGPAEAKGAKALDSYTWHTDLAPGTPMTTGHQSMDYDLATLEHANYILLMGTNLLATKMPCAHWVTESRMKGAHVVDVTIDYHATANKADDVIIIRPGTDCAFALGLANVLIAEKLYDEKYLLSNTDMPLLVRTDTWANLKAGDVIAGYEQAKLSHHIKMLGDKDPLPLPIAFHDTAIVRESLRKEWGDAMVWDKKTDKAVPLSRDKCGAQYASAGVEPALTGGFSVKLVSGKTVKVVPIFQLIKEYLDEFSPENTAALCACPSEAIVDTARHLANNKRKSIIATGAGNNHYFNMHLKDRALLLVGALTDNIGHIGGCSIGNFVGNYRVSLYGGLGQFLIEDPFNPQLTAPQLKDVKDRKLGMAPVKKYAHDESANFYNYGDRPLKVGTRMLTDPGHMPAPTKTLWQSNSNSSLGNAKWHYDLVINTMPRWEMVCYSDWNWSGSCEYSDIVWGIDSWMEAKHTDMSASCTNSFMYVQPITPMKRVHDTRGDMEVYAGVSRALAKLTGDKRFADYWHFVTPGGFGTESQDSEVYLQRILNASQAARGYNVAEVREKAMKGIPSLMMNRTYPRVSGWEQSGAVENKPWYTKTGRLEFYKDDARFIEAGENLPVYREPVDSTRFEPNVIIGKSRAFALMASPESYGLETDGNSLTIAENRQGRNVVLTTAELMKTHHPLKSQGYNMCFNTPKYRHGAHTTPIDTDLMTLWWGPFGDIYRHDKRKPSTGEGFADINPIDAKKHGIDEGDYMWVDADPGDRPYRGWKEGTSDYELARFKVRARYYGGISPGTVRMYFNAYGSTYGSVEGQKTRADGLAKNPRTNYQAMMRTGSHQSCTRAWLAPTLMTDTLVHKTNLGQEIVKGHEADIHCANGAPKESFVKVSLCEKGGTDGGVWRVAALGWRPTYENDAMKKYLKGGFVG